MVAEMFWLRPREAQDDAEKRVRLDYVKLSSPFWA